MASGKKIIKILGWSLGILVFMAGGVFSQGQAENAQPVPTQAKEFEGTVKIGLGKYFYLPNAQGLDIMIQGKLESGGDASSLTGKDVRVKGELLADKPSIFRADAIEMKDASGSFRKIFTRTQDLVLGDFLDGQARESYKPLTMTNAAKNEEWEGKGKVKVFGTIQKAAEPGGPTYIVLSNGPNKEVGKIIVDKTTDYAAYYLKKLRLFNEFWFYLSVKESVDAKVRIKSRELFHADVTFCGLF